MLFNYLSYLVVRDWTLTCLQAALTERAALMASVPGNQPGYDAASDLSDYESVSRRTPTPRSRREREPSLATGKDRKDEQIRIVENQVWIHRWCFLQSCHVS